MSASAMLFLIPIISSCSWASVPWMMAALIGLGISDMVLRWWVSQPGTAAPWRYVTQLLSLGLLFFFGRVLGPLWLVTTPLLTHAIFNALSARPGPRTFALVSSCGLLLLAVGLEQLGVLTPSYSETSAGLLVRPNLAICRSASPWC